MNPREFLSSYSEWHAFGIGVSLSTVALTVHPAMWGVVMYSFYELVKGRVMGRGFFKDIRLEAHYYAGGVVFPVIVQRTVQAVV